MDVMRTAKDLSNHLFLDGKMTSAKGSTFYDVMNPATEEVFGQIAEATDTEIEEAIEVANRARKEWFALSALERAERLHEVAIAFRAASHPVGEMMTREMGKAFKESSDEVIWGATVTDYYAEIGRHEGGKVFGPAVAGQLHYTVKEPMGVVVCVMPFNYPVALLMWEAAAALAAGNAVIVKPSELTSLTTLMLMECFSSLPAGLIQVVTGGAKVGAKLVASNRTHMVAFTGSVPAGKAIASACAEQFKPALIEASGNDAFIVMPSAPIDIAARGAVFAAFVNCGQVCTSAERIYVHEDIYDQFMERFIFHTKALRVGNGLGATDVGPMASKRELDRFTALVNRAVEAGATVACGGKRPDGMEKGWFFEPTILTDVTSDMEIVNGESFGPVAPVVKISSLDEAIALANKSAFGLGFNIYTLSLPEAIKASNEVEVGIVWVNAPLLDNDAGAFGGRKLSGLGKELGTEGLDTFQHTKLVMIDPEASDQDFWWFPYKSAECFPEISSR
ncbi:aldehyde dehydrogenase [Acetobacter estunensis]|uniref:aldehyde dehydrogenase family protein n=1 Tax=Acetobacter estunensis TaxID=104097 RepID=UPI001C2CEFC0|nr:aldehyde dehydrogenase family protein [Acetobacter estunensis]MBV1837921.1 aldehyde dehydrogenase family protein [Acetobacter estunensis]